MATSQTSKVIEHLRRAVLLREGAGLTDGQLLEDYIRHRDEAALAALVRRHGAMVWGVCRRVLRNYHDAEDAFQATFLVFVRKAATIASPELLANWLYGVAHQTALKARATTAKRRARERQVIEMPEPAVPEEELWNELRPLLDQALSRLPDKYRVAIVRCDLEGETRKEAARQLGVPEGTLAARLARGRKMLAARLARHGLAVSGGLLAAMLAQNTASASVPATVVGSTIRAASVFAAGHAAVTGGISVKVVTLMEGVLKTMLLSKVKIAITVLLVFGITTLGAGALVSRTLATEPAEGMFPTQKQGQANPDDLHERVVELKQQLQQMQKQIARLERETRLGRKERDTCDTTFLANRFKYRVPFEIGYTESTEGGRIEIREVWGTRPRIEIGGQYLVRGKYVLPPGERGQLYFYATAGGAWGAITTTLDLQSTAVEKQEGEFALVHGMLGPGSFHLVLADPERYSRMFANVYFGTGDNVYRRKP